MLKIIEEGGEGGGILFFILLKKIFDEVSFYFYRDFFTPQRAVFYFVMTFYSDAGGHLDLGINLEWPKTKRFDSASNLKKLHWLPIKFRIKYKLMMMAHEVMHPNDMAIPKYIYYLKRSNLKNIIT